jgi:hypothetical protein
MEKVVRLLPINTFEVFNDLVSVVLKVIDNITAHPEDPKYRKMKLSNATIKRKIVDVNGGLELMRALGFKRDADEKGYELLVMNLPEEVSSCAEPDMSQFTANPHADNGSSTQDYCRYPCMVTVSRYLLHAVKVLNH